MIAPTPPRPQPGRGGRGLPCGRLPSPLPHPALSVRPMPETDTRTTALHDRHLALGAKMVPFAGFDMPIQYSGILDEHRAVREAAGLFDVSHMGEFRLRGPDALALAQRLVTNDVSKLDDGKALYAVLCHASGGAVDDLLVYRLAEDDVMLVVNAANVEKDWGARHGRGRRRRPRRGARGRVRGHGAAGASGAAGVRDLQGGDGTRRVGDRVLPLRPPPPPATCSGPSGSSCRRPGTRARRGWRSTSPPRRRAGRGTRSWRPAPTAGCSRPGSAPATRSAWRPGSASTATSSPTTRRRSRRTSGGPSSWTPATSSAATRSRRRRRAGWRGGSSGS